MNTTQNYNADRHSANNRPLWFDLTVSTYEGKQGETSKFEVLFLALTEFKDAHIEQMEKCRFDRDDEYTMYAQTVQTIDELLASLTMGLYSANKVRVRLPHSENTGAIAVDSQPPKVNGSSNESEQIAWWKAQNANLLSYSETLLQLLKQRGGPTEDQ